LKEIKSRENCPGTTDNFEFEYLSELEVICKKVLWYEAGSGERGWIKNWKLKCLETVPMIMLDYRRVNEKLHSDGSVP
jgi:hypothetical protein